MFNVLLYLYAEPSTFSFDLFDTGYDTIILVGPLICHILKGILVQLLVCLWRKPLPEAVALFGPLLGFVPEAKLVGQCHFL